MADNRVKVIDLRGPSNRVACGWPVERHGADALVRTHAASGVYHSGVFQEALGERKKGPDRFGRRMILFAVR